MLLVVYAEAFLYPSFSPELATFYVLNQPPQFDGLLNEYLTFGGGWYRPSIFFTYYRTITCFFDWHSLYAFKVASLILLLLLGVTIYVFSRMLFNDNSYTSLVAAVASITSPLLFICIYESTGFDFIYQIFVLLVVIVFISLSRSSSHVVPRIVLGLIFYLVALTCKEQAITLPVFLVGVLVIDLFFRRKGTIVQQVGHRGQLILAGGTVLMTGLYYYLHARIMPTHTGGYRTEFDWEMISTNLIRLPLWLTHLFFDRAGFYIDVHDTALNNSYGMGMLVVTVSSVVFLILRRRFTELRESFILIAFVLSYGERFL